MLHVFKGVECRIDTLRSYLEYICVHCTRNEHVEVQKFKLKRSCSQNNEQNKSFLHNFKYITYDKDRSYLENFSKKDVKKSNKAKRVAFFSNFIKTNHVFSSIYFVSKLILYLYNMYIFLAPLLIIYF